jgi:hypothetical protein
MPLLKLIWLLRLALPEALGLAEEKAVKLLNSTLLALALPQGPATAPPLELLEPEGFQLAQLLPLPPEDWVC